MLSVQNLSFSYGSNLLFDEVSFSVAENSKVGLVGSNGAGKTTIFKLIAGLLNLEKGTVNVGNLAYLPQQFDFKDLTVSQFLDDKLDGLPSFKVDRALSLLGLSDINRDQKADDLSGGQKNRLFLASLSALNDQLDLLLLDEPTNNLDLEGLNWLEDFINNFKGSVLLTSHDRYFLDSIEIDKVVDLSEAMG